MAQIINKTCLTFAAAMAPLVLAFIAGSPAAAQTVKSNIDQMTGWQSCTACAGVNASGPSAAIYSNSGAGSPSLDGNSRAFHISSSTSYADALWWKQLGAANGAYNLVYDLYFYIKTPQYAQALEFDNNQANGSKRWIFGTQCNIAAGHWDVWGNAAGNWIS